MIIIYSHYHLNYLQTSPTQTSPCPGSIQPLNSSQSTPGRKAQDDIETLISKLKRAEDNMRDVQSELEATRTKLSKCEDRKTPKPGQNCSNANTDIILARSTDLIATRKDRDKCVANMAEVKHKLDECLSERLDDDKDSEVEHAKMLEQETRAIACEGLLKECREDDGAQATGKCREGQLCANRCRGLGAAISNAYNGNQVAGTTPHWRQHKYPSISACAKAYMKDDNCVDPVLKCMMLTKETE